MIRRPALCLCVALLTCAGSHSVAMSGYWARTCGSSGTEIGVTARATLDGGAVIAGWKGLFGEEDFWVVKVDIDGQVEWERSYGVEGASEMAFSVDVTTNNGYVVAGVASSYGSEDLWILQLTGSGDIGWQKRYDTTADEGGRAIRQTADKGFIVSGYTTAGASSGWNGWVLKLDDSGGIVWQRVLGGIDEDTGDDILESIMETDDGGFLGVGDWRNTTPGGTTEDLWMVRLDSSGGIVWNLSVGDAASEEPIGQHGTSAVETTNHDLLIRGYVGLPGSEDLWLLKVAPSGSLLWQKAYGGMGIDEANGPYGLDLLPDGNLLMAGHTYAYGSGDADGWILELDDQGIPVWQRTYGGPLDDRFYSVQQSLDGGIVAGGYTGSYGAGLADAWILRLDEVGKIDCSCQLVSTSSTSAQDTSYPVTQGPPMLASPSVAVESTAVVAVDTSATTHDACEQSYSGEIWARSFGDAVDDERANWVEQSPGGGFIVAGWEMDPDERVRGNLTKLDEAGYVEWAKDYRGSGQPSPWDGYFRRVQPFLNEGTTEYYAVGTRSPQGSDDSDLWVTRIDSGGNLIWSKTIGGAAGDEVFSALELSGDLIIIGTTDSFGAGSQDAWVMRVGSSGSILWQKTYGGDGTDQLRYAELRDPDNKLVLVGFTSSFGSPAGDAWVVEIDPDTGALVSHHVYGTDSRLEILTAIGRHNDGFLLAGVSFDGEGLDGLALGIDGGFDLGWSQTLGGTGTDEIHSMDRRPWQGAHPSFVLAGASDSFGGDSDQWIMRMTAQGDLLWDKAFGDTGSVDQAFCVTRASDGSFVIGGETAYLSAAGADLSVLKMEPDGTIGQSCPYLRDVSSNTSPAGLVKRGSPPLPTVVDTDATPQSWAVDVSDASDLDDDLCRRCVAPEEVSPASTDQALVLEGDKATLLWEEAALNGADSFTVFRGDIAADLKSGCAGCPYYGAEVESGLLVNTLTDSSAPSAGVAWFYLVTGVSAQGCEGSLGYDSYCEERPPNHR